jgi:tRNA G18 (ribose-2'-O)-methylase SpoU
MIRKKSTKDLGKEREKNREKLKTGRAPIYVIADSIRSLDNVGLLFRLCELIRVKKLYLCGITGYPKGQKLDRRHSWKIERADQRIKKTAIYAVPFVPWEYKRSALSVVKKLKKEGVQIVALEQASGSVDYREANYNLPLALVVGHEIKGVSQKIIEEADTVAEIPTYGIGNSLNVAIASGIALYEIVSKTDLDGKM